MDLCHVPTTREKGWYLALMAPNVKGPNYAWLDPSRLYCHPQVHSPQGWRAPAGVPGWAAAPRGCQGTRPCPQAPTHGLQVPVMGCGHPAPPLSPQGLQDCVADLLQPFQGDPIDMVAGIDAMGFILGERGRG